jgi:hypothetical protein
MSWVNWKMPFPSPVYTFRYWPSTSVPVPEAWMRKAVAVGGAMAADVVVVEVVVVEGRVIKSTTEERRVVGITEVSVEYEVSVAVISCSSLAVTYFVVVDVTPTMMVCKALLVIVFVTLVVLPEDLRMVRVVVFLHAVFVVYTVLVDAAFVMIHLHALLTRLAPYVLIQLEVNGQTTAAGTGLRSSIPAGKFRFRGSTVTLATAGTVIVTVSVCTTE